MLSDHYSSLKELHRETIATLALLYNNSSIQLLLYTLPPMDYELEIFNYCIDFKKM